MTNLNERAAAMLAAHNEAIEDCSGFGAKPVTRECEMAALIRELLAENERLRGDYAEKLSALRADAESWRALRKSDGPGTMRNPYALALGADTPLAAPAVDPTLAPYSVSDAGPSPFQGRTTRREELS